METQDKHLILRIPLLLLVCVVLFSFGVGAVSAAGTSGNSTIYVSTDGDDAWDGLSPVYNTTSGPKKTIKNATGTVAINGTVYIAPGTYTESKIVIDKDMTITGENQKNTIINGQQSGNSIFNILSGITVNINNLTLTNNTVTNSYGGAIYNNGGVLTVTNCTLTNNTANNTAYGRGGAIYNNGGVLTVINCTFTDNTVYEIGGAICNGYGGVLTVINCTFTNNSAANYGGAICNSYDGKTLAVINCTFTNNSAKYYGGAIHNWSGVLTLTNCKFTNNTANISGGAIANDGKTLTLTNCTFTNNTANSSGGAILNKGVLTVINCTLTNNSAFRGAAISNSVSDGSSVVVHFNRIVGNSPSNSQIYSDSGLVDARLNWWGSNINPSCYVNGNVDVSSWLVLNVKSDPANVLNGGNSTVTVDLLHDNTGAYHDPVNGHVPDGIVVDFASGLGSLKPVSAVLVNGSATSVFTATTSGSGSITATVDSQTVSAPINHVPTPITVDPVSGYAGQNVALKAHVMDSYGNPVKYGWVTFWVNGTVIGAAGVSNGLATISWTIPTTWIVGVYGVVAEYSGSSNYMASTNTTNLTVTPFPTSVTVDPVSGQRGQTVILNAHVVDCRGNPVKYGWVTFWVNGTVIGAAGVSNGLATISDWIIPSTWTSGVYGVTAEYSGGNYLSSTNGTNLTVTPTPTGVIVDPVSGHAGQNVILTAHMLASDGDYLNDGRVTFRVNGTVIGSGNVSNGLATINWIIPSTWTSGVYNITADYSGSSNYFSSVNGTFLTLEPSAYLYMNVTNSKNNPGVGDKFVLTYKLSNGGPDNATNVIISFQIPTGLEFVTANVDSGTYTYNPTNRTITWTLNNVEVGDPYLYLTLQALTSGKYTILPVISSDTFNRNMDALKPFVINVESQNGSNDSKANSTVVDAASSTVVMHNTGMPLVGFVLAILAVLGGMFAPRRK